ncbi:alpha/beta hydrolase family protein [Paenibacillus sp.]|uniref:alpha/beta hydrolase n=1 Tax=Paenibacillus sp. TaxID=58172 RepID=UPI002D6BF113|nr:alpha/beta hydrolase family protein [Paenibacillus sp.]HZG56447.1 alpha/beta hydrolase family protein [Paenibacillus sp.]
MAILRCNFFSDALQLSTSMTVILPQKTYTQIGMAGAGGSREKLPTLYLLHGLSDDDTIWTRRTSVERYAASYGLAIVMPNVHRSFYVDMAYGGRYWTFLSEELPALARSFFPLSAEREDNFAAGLSMGGYGAMKWALSRPDALAAAASLSGAVDIAAKRRDPEPWLKPALDLAFGERELTGTEHDLFALLDAVDRSAGPKPKLYQACGTEDFLYPDNVAFRDACRRTSLDTSYEEGPGGHDWAYWDAKIQDVLRWLPIR